MLKTPLQPRKRAFPAPPCGCLICRLVLTRSSPALFNQSEHGDVCEAAAVSKTCEILLILPPQRCSDSAASRTHRVSESSAIRLFALGFFFLACIGECDSRARTNDLCAVSASRLLRHLFTARSVLLLLLLRLSGMRCRLSFY